MSDYDHAEEMDEAGGDDQSEDGEMKSPKDSPMQLSKDDALFTMSEEENDDTTDSLDIKPPQAITYHHVKTSRPTSRSKHGERDTRREHSSHSHTSSKSGKSHGHRHRDERQREKRHTHRERREAAEGRERGREMVDVRERPREVEVRERGREGEGRERAREAVEVRERVREVVEVRGERVREVVDVREREGRERAREVAEGRSREGESRERAREVAEGRDRARDMVEGRERTREVVETREKVREPDVRERGREAGERGREVEGRERAREVVESRRDGTESRERSRERAEGRVAKEKADRVLEDLRERLLDKRRAGEREGAEARRELDHGRKRRAPQQQELPSRERDERRERLLEADRQKEVYRRELEARRERRHTEKEKERTMREIVERRERSRSRERKKMKLGAEEEGEHKDEELGKGGDDGDGDTHVVTLTSSESEASEEGEEAAEGEVEVEEASSEGEEEESDSKTDSDEDVADTDESPGADTDDEEVEEEEAEEAADGKESDNDSFTETTAPVSTTAGVTENNGKADLEGDAADMEVEAGGEELPPYLPAVSGCRSVEEFQCLNRIEEGTYGVVYRARDRSNQEVVALKRLKMEKEKEGFPITSLREINTLLKAQHKNIVTVREIVVGSNMDKIFIVMDYVEHDLKSLMETMKQKKQVFIPGEVKCLMQQLLRAVAHLHDNWILHRDLKTSNLLLSHKGILKVGDFGLAREYGSPLKAYTPIVVTLWYRSPELLLCTKEYSTPIDMWSVGCIFGEFLSMEALFPGKSEVDQINRIFKDLGTPNEKIWPGYSKLPAVVKMTFQEYPTSQLRKRFGTMITQSGLDLMNKFLTYDPAQRITAEDALKHSHFEEAPLPIDPAMFPTWPAKSELGHRKAAAPSPKPPPGGAGYKQLGDTDEDVPVGDRGFHMGVTENRRIVMGAGFSLKF